MAFKSLFGRFLVAMFFFMSAAMKFTEPASHEAMLLGSYTSLYKEFFALSGFNLPISPALLGLQVHALIQLTAALMVLGGILFVSNVRIGAYLLSLLLLSFNVVIHNPWLYTGAERNINIVQNLLNFGWIAGLLLICGEKEEKEKKE
ncbi:unnamed protein product [Blepharisma stoltei]|uniref:DoxX family protein n=1 Tax=Blepharisma stoltei TaxID=1481888 RepID=A0AAU9JCM1_9CILI|nr:unnamed protein product [Blepharisma stoltei]